MKQSTVLGQIAKQLDLNATSLRNYVKDDIQPGYVGNRAGRPLGLNHLDDIQVLYALVRALEPERVLELGTNRGSGATHMAQALADNGHGHLWSVDKCDPEYQGHAIPDELRPYVTLIQGDINLFHEQVSEPFDFVFEDGSHTRYQVRQVYRFLNRYLRPGAVICSHDTEVDRGHPDSIGDTVRSGQALELGFEPPSYQIGTSHCGISVYRWEG